MNQSICPYPGLRPFNEEESIFFKGREQQVERLVKRLEEKKFLMVNGASGDGKSSLIYAGVIPHAKAGFFKAKYNNWIVADFRPERSPLKNLTASICRQLKIEDTAKTEKELGYGFSALCDLYKASSFYIDETKPEWLNADEKERKVIKRKGANLLVLVDQFEEFFTNPENYQNGIPSIESQKTVNLLLETYKLATAQDLPIYVVCTMRSDYIGQCAAFRGLPEAIGYSQFFVPRLKRQEIEQVIVGPAKLAGCSVSIRLIQTLLNSLNEGFDQLPIMQHALNQIWKMADHGHQEMDLIHLAKVGGIAPKLLLPEDKLKFERWFETIPTYKKQLLSTPSLSNVLNMHANELMIFASDSYQSISNQTISEESVKAIIETSFKALTRVDAGRAVRRRTTPLEIINLHRSEKIDLEKLNAVLTIFRLQGNTFLQPFMGENGEHKIINEHTILDITHESLIRNWNLLRNWAYEENENYNTWKEVEKQLNRWVDSKFSSQYLLAIGPLSIYKAWFENFKPNKYWLLKYDDSKVENTIKERKADEIIQNLASFLRKSDFALKKKRRLLIGFTSLAFVLLGSLAYWAFTQYIRSESFLQLANVQTVNALNEKAKAEKQKEMALAAKNEAENSKLKAIESAEIALSAKDAANKAKAEALLLKNIAELEKNKALKQTVIAKRESEKAGEQKLIAEKAKDMALLAEEKAKKLSLMALAQNLAYKSTFIDNDHQLKALLALEAYYIASKLKNEVKDPAIYEALRAAQSDLEFRNFKKQNNTSLYIEDIRTTFKRQANLKGTSVGYIKTEPAAMSFSSTLGHMIIAGKMPYWFDWNCEKDSLNNICYFGKSKEIRNVWMSADAYILLSQYANNEILCWSPGFSIGLKPLTTKGNIKNYKGQRAKEIKIELPRKIIVKAAFSPNSSSLVIAYKDSTIMIFKIINNKDLYISLNKTCEFKLLDNVQSLAVSNDGNTVYYGNLKGLVNSIAIQENKTTKNVFKPSDRWEKNKQTVAKAICLNLAADESYLGVGYNDGNIGFCKFVNGDIKSYQLYEKHAAQVEQLIFDENAQLMITAGADKAIKVFELNNLASKPVTIRNHGEKVRSLLLYDGHTLIGAGLSGVIWKWELNSENLKAEIEPQILRQLTEEEWKYFIGNEIEYENRIIKK
jgi:energy-coupling factor transporter ATP-binding protein EcfA2